MFFSPCAPLPHDIQPIMYVLKGTAEVINWGFTRDGNTILENISSLLNPTDIYIKQHVHMTPMFQLRQS